MTRGEKVKRFLIGGVLLVGGLLSLFTGPTLKYVVGGALIFFGILFVTDKANKAPGLLSLLLGGLFVASTYFIWGILLYVGILSLITGGYISYNTYKKINSY